MRSFLAMAIRRSIFAIFVCGALAQTPQPVRALDDGQVQKLYERTLQLMDAGGIFVPDLTRAAHPLVENARQTLESLKFLGFRSPQLHARWLEYVRSYLVLADTLPKPDPFPAEARRQLSELRDCYYQSDANFQALLTALQYETRDPDRDELKRYAEDNQRLAAPQPGNPRVVFMGDSITDAWRLNEYYPGRDFVNRGISGQVTGQMLARFLPDVVSLHPAAVLILAGTNDIRRQTDIVTTESNLTAMCDLADHHRIKVILASLLPVHDYNAVLNAGFEQSKKRSPQVIRLLNDWLMMFAQKRGYVFLNYCQPMLDVRAMLTKEYSDDGLHPNPAGYRVMAPLALAAIDKAVGPTSPQPPPRRRRLF